MYHVQIGWNGNYQIRKNELGHFQQIFSFLKKPYERFYWDDDRLKYFMQQKMKNCHDQSTQAKTKTLKTVRIKSSTMMKIFSIILVDIS